MSIAENVAAIRAAMESAAMEAGRDPKEIKLCAATKMNGAAAVRQAIAAGVDVCGENRVQELTQKLGENAYLGAPVHFIGHLQTNKVKQVVGKVDLIQSIGSLHLLEAVNKEAARQNLRQDILLEVNIGEEAAKTGFAAGDILPLIDKIDSFSKCGKFMLTYGGKRRIMFWWTAYPWACPGIISTRSAAAAPWCASAPPFLVKGIIDTPHLKM